ncbi:uncharacterized protein LOC106474158 [Limulus polyphemus]|uniref:Uncharacterized protein LOC106474158 n=1 Tax=Limulus polyphemus TaxID=6850 RepID=A0ABM1TQS8_LIMPO|nr:uncharacterized protein LOC106474158 [Limulus polyphemus]XP_013790303.1 uncharacterized protein LOC106474158 [Limulus polyphemus]XP_022258234.1 uncharacterized protein LOC106474158 [Limulus polyphemus]
MSSTSSTKQTSPSNCKTHQEQGCCQPDESNIQCNNGNIKRGCQSYENCTSGHDKDKDECCQSDEHCMEIKPDDTNTDKCEHGDSHHHCDAHDDEEAFLLEATHKDVMPPEKTCEIYDKHADYYEKFIIKHESETWYVIVTELMNFLKEKSGRILDVGAGTGATSNVLKQRGYNNIDALDGSEGMLKIAKTKNIYQNFIHLILKGGVRIPNIENDTYSAVVLNGVFCPNHCDSEVFPELIRVVKPGGYICWTINIGENKDEEKFNNDVENLCKEGKWKKLLEKVHDGYYGEEKITIMEVL